MYNRYAKRRVGGLLTSVADLFKEQSSGDNSHYKRLADIMHLKRSWVDLVGAQIAKNSFPYRIKDNVLLVSVADPIFIAELPYIKDELLVRISKEIPLISDVRFTLSKVKAKVKKRTKPLRKLTEIEATEIDRLSSVITDDKIRDAYRKAFLAYKGRHNER
ncbi:MAG: DUF721 domain-containing protein [Deferribacteraceae bacterium]|jgi:hypothetical protein|nr:DUF721 domain-containing protein [Deferribacteraceae bacterium]